VTSTFTYLIQYGFNYDLKTFYSSDPIFSIFFSEIGVGLAGFGVAFLFLGVLLLFDKGLLAIGNVGPIFGQGILKGKYHCNVDLLFGWFGISPITGDIFCFICKTD